MKESPCRGRGAEREQKDRQAKSEIRTRSVARKKKGKYTCVEDEWCMMGLVVSGWTCCRKILKKDAVVSNKSW